MGVKDSVLCFHVVSVQIVKPKRQKHVLSRQLLKNDTYLIISSLVGFDITFQ